MYSSYSVVQMKSLIITPLEEYSGLITSHFVMHNKCSRACKNLYRAHIKWLSVFLESLSGMYIGLGYSNTSPIIESFTQQYAENKLIVNIILWSPVEGFVVRPRCYGNWSDDDIGLAHLVTLWNNDFELVCYQLIGLYDKPYHGR